MKEGHEYIYGLTETKRLLSDSSLSKEEVRETLIGIVKWTIPDHSWYWDNLFESYPKMKKKSNFWFDVLFVLKITSSNTRGRKIIK